jgi:hypothetical protein
VEPQPGSACATTDTCSYDWCGASNVTATCVDGAWEVQYGSTCNPPPPQECPVTAPYGQGCWEAGVVCTYSDECGNPFEATCDGATWQVGEPGTSCNPPPPECPLELPTAGLACPDPAPAIGCPYEVPSVCGTLFVVASCVADAFGGTAWTVEGDTCMPPTPDCASYATSAACLLDASCRWLEPGCGDGMQLEATAGCYPKDDCMGGGGLDSCGDGLTCTEVIANPCWNSMCDACGATAYVCQ